jgi:AraC-like DNA-binding protein
MYGIKKIKEILIDKDNNLALVTYVCGYTPTDYFHKLRKIDTDLIEKTFANHLRIERESEMTLKKWDKRWRIQK